MGEAAAEAGGYLREVERKVGQRPPGAGSRPQGAGVPWWRQARLDLSF